MKIIAVYLVMILQSVATLEVPELSNYPQVLFGEEKVKGDRVITPVILYREIPFNKRLPEFPNIEEDCHDGPNRFANWQQGVTISRSGSIEFGGDWQFFTLNLGLSREKSTEFIIERWVHAQEGVKALHTLYMSGFDIEGVRYRKIENIRTGEVLWKKRKIKAKFKLEKQNLSLYVKRELIGECPSF